MARVIPAVIEQHRDEAGFLWILRSQAVVAPHYHLNDLIDLDERLASHLDGLAVAGDAGWEACRESLERRDPGELFAAAVIAFQSGRAERTEAVLAAAGGDPALWRAAASALAWLEWPCSAGPTRGLLAAEAPEHRRIGIAAAALHRVPLRREMIAALEVGEAPVIDRALKAAGELGERELLPLVVRRLSSTDEETRFQAARAAALLGDPRGKEPLMAAAASDGPRELAAIAVVAALLSRDEARRWIQTLTRRPGGERAAVIAAGKTGDPAWVPWLIECMRVPGLARPAGEALSAITGVELAAEDLDADAPEGFDAGPTEDPEDERVALDPDENLEWPDVDRIEHWWRLHRKEFPDAVPLLSGRPITRESCLALLRRGNQRRRADAALRLALLGPGSPLFEVRAPGRRQAQILATENPTPEGAADRR